MELLMKNIHMCRQIRQSSIQMTLEDDLNVPDAKPDAEMTIQSRECVVIEHTRAEKGKLLIDGFMDVSILYQDNTSERQLHRLDKKIPFDTSLTMEGLEPDDDVRLRHDTEDLNVSLINSRKLAVRALLSFEASVEELYDMSAAVEPQSRLTLCERRKKLELMQLQVQKKDILRLKEEVQLPANKPGIREILWTNVQLRAAGVQLRDEKIRIQGKLSLFVLFRTEESTANQWMEQMIPFEGELACSGCSVELIPDIELQLAKAEVQVKEDADGEPRILKVEGVIELEIRMYGNEEAEILEDLYSPEKEISLTMSEESYDSLVMKNNSKCRAAGKIRIQGAKPRILQICHISGSIKIDKTEIVEGGIQIDGAVPVSILYISADDTMPFAVLEGIVPFSHFAEAAGIDENCRFTLTTAVDQLTAVMADSEEIEVRLTASLDLLVIRPVRQLCIQDAEEQDYNPERLESVPGITGYVVQEGDSLWKIGKTYFLTPAQIMKMNELEKEEVKKGDKLILMKQISGIGAGIADK